MDSTSFTVNCTSTGSPATSVLWTKDGQLISAEEGVYDETQVLFDATTATYFNLLTVYAEPEDILGQYTCSVNNSIGIAATESITFEGLS